LRSEIELTGTLPVESFVNGQTGSTFTTTLAAGNIYNFFIKHDTLNRTYISVFDDNGTPLGINNIGSTELKLNNDIDLSSFPVNYIYYNRSPFNSDPVFRSTFFNINHFRKSLSSTEMVNAINASKLYFNTRQNVALRNIGGIHHKLTTVSSNATLIPDNSGVLLLSATTPQTISLNSNTLQPGSNCIGKEWTLNNIGTSVFNLSGVGVNISGSTQIPVNSQCKILQTGLSNVKVDTLLTTDTSGADIRFNNSTLFARDISCTDMIIDTTGIA
jgi:hypothetical protein